MAPVSKKLKASTGEKEATSSKPRIVDNSEAMDVDTGASAPRGADPEASDEESGGDDESVSDSGSGSSIDTDTEIAIAQQPTKSKQTLSKFYSPLRPPCGT